MKKSILLTAMVLLVMTGLAQAQELGIDIDATYVSKYLWRGFDILDDVSAFQPSININFGDTGFSFNLWTSYAGSGGNNRVNLTEYDYTLAYGNTLFEGETYATDFTANYIYYDFIDQPSRGSSTVPAIADTQELGVAFAWPNVCPMGIVPSYYVGKIWESRSNSTLGKNYGGWIHIFGLGYDLAVPGLIDTADQIISISAAAVYNDGYAGATVEHDWSHIVWGASTSIDYGPGTFTPAIYYQTSMDDTVNTENEFWTSMSYTISF